MSGPEEFRRERGQASGSNSVTATPNRNGRSEDEPRTLRADRIDGLLDAWQVPAMRPDLRRRLLSIPALEPGPANPLWRLARPWLTAGGLAAAAALGAAVGVSPLGEAIEQAVGLGPVPEDQLVAMLDVIVEDTLQ